MRSKLSIPMGNAVTGEMHFSREVTGEVVGPFLVHPEASAFMRGWVVPHRPTGYAVLNEIPSERNAKWLARELQKVGVDWQFANPDTVKTFPKEALAQIKDLRLQARQAPFHKVAA